MKTFLIIVIMTFILGIGFMGGLYYLNRIHSQQSADLTKLGYKPVTSAPQSLDFNLSSPDDNQLVFNKSILVQGKSASGSTVIIATNSDDTEIKSSQTGDFSATITLDPGLNYITVAAFDGFGNFSKDSRTIYYSTEQI